MTAASQFAGYAARLRAFMGDTLVDHARAGSSSARDFEETFSRLALDLFALQFSHNPAYRRLCDAQSVSLGTVRDWREIAAVPTSAFKELEVTSLPASGRSVVFHSSGTTGQRPSRHFHDAESLALYEASLLPWFRLHLLPRTMPPRQPSSIAAETRPRIISLTPGP